MKRALFTAFLMVAMVGTAYSQARVLTQDIGDAAGIGIGSGNAVTSDAMDVYLTVISQLVITSTTPLDFGFVTQGSTGTTEAAQGVFNIAGETDATVTIQSGTATDLVDSGGGNPITWTPSLLSTSETLTGGSATVNIGGTLGAIDAAAPEGDYTATYEVQVFYTAI